jgi:hypothetical protein
MYDPTLHNLKTIASNNALTLYAENATSKILGNTLNLYQLGPDGTLRQEHLFPSGSFGVGNDEVTDDGTSFFFIETNASGVQEVLKMPMDGSAGAAPIGDLPGDVSIFYSLVGTTDNTVLVHGATNQFTDPENLYSVPKSPASPPVAAKLLGTIAPGASFAYLIAQGNVAYYSTFSDDGKTVQAVAARDDGSSTVVTNNAHWGTFVLSQSAAGLYADRPVTDLLQVHGFTDHANTVDAGATVTLFHLADGSHRDLFTFNYGTGISVVPFFPDLGTPQGVGLIRLSSGPVTSSPTFQNDAFAFDITATTPAAAFVQLTNTPNISEQLIQDMQPGITHPKRLSSYH